MYQEFLQVLKICCELYNKSNGEKFIKYTPRPPMYLKPQNICILMCIQVEMIVNTRNGKNLNQNTKSKELAINKTQLNHQFRRMLKICLKNTNFDGESNCLTLLFETIYIFFRTLYIIDSLSFHRCYTR